MSCNNFKNHLWHGMGYIVLLNHLAELQDSTATDEQRICSTTLLHRDQKKNRLQHEF